MLALLLVLAQMPQHRLFMQPNLQRQAGGGIAPYSFCDLLQSGDKSGSWGCINGDQTTSGPVTFSGVNSPAVTSGLTCASPSYSTTDEAATKYFRSATVAAPSGAFSTCILAKPTTTWDSTGVFGQGDGVSHYPYESILSGANWTNYFEGGGTFNIGTSSWPPIGNVPVLVCIVFSGGTATLYAAGSSRGSGSGVTIANQNGRIWLANDGFGAIIDGKFYGGFTTEKALSATDIGRLSQAANCDRVGWVGDSLSANGSVFNGAPPNLVQALTGTPVDSYAVSSAQFLTGTSPPSCQLQWLQNNSDKMARKLVVQCGVNDLLNDVDAGTLWPAYRTWLNDRIDAGITVVPVTITPFKNYGLYTASRGAARVAFNAELIAWCPTNPGAHCIDTRAGADAGGLADPDDLARLYEPFNVGDGLHYNDAGMLRDATLISNGW